MKRPTTFVLTLAALMSLLSASSLQAQVARPVDEPLELQVYPVGDLVMQVPSYTYGPSAQPTQPYGVPRTIGPALPTTGPATSNPVGGMGGMGGGGIGMGGGFMQIAAEQVGTDPYAGGTEMGGYGGGGGVAAPAMQPSPMRDLARAITESVEPSTWRDGGGAGSCTIYGTSLLITQTASVHDKIAALLEMLRATSAASRIVNIEARWLPLDSEQLAQLLGRGRDGSPTGQTAVPAVLDELTTTVPSLRGQVTCFSGQSIFLASGERRNVITSLIPVVGSLPAYQPVSAVPNVGVLLQGSATLMPETSEAVLDLTSTVTEWKDAGPPAIIGGAYPATEGREGSLESSAPTPAGLVSAPVDRVILDTQQMAATLRVPLGKPVLVGGLTKSPNEAHGKDGTDRPQLYLVVRVNEVTP